jgi:hypothetical protein
VLRQKPAPVTMMPTTNCLNHEKAFQLHSEADTLSVILWKETNLNPQGRVFCSKVWHQLSERFVYI